MEKQQLLAEIRQAAAEKLITKEEILAEFGQPAAPDDAMNKRLSLSEILYYLGSAIIFLGISVLCYQNWDSFSSPLRIFIALGSMIAAFLVATLLYRYENLKKISQAFFLIAGMLAPLALNVTFKEIGLDLSSDGIQLLIYVILTALFLGSLLFYKQSILLFFGIVFTTAIFHFIINLVVGETTLMANYSQIWEYRILVIGLAWALLGNYFAGTMYKALTGAMYGFGCLFFLGSALALGGWQPNQSAFWELIYPVLVFGVIFLSVYVKSKSFLVFGTIFLILYILKLTGEYFTSGLGWPLSLVLAGLAIIGIGYYAVKLNKKYLGQGV